VRSITWKLIAAFIIVVIVSVGLTALLVSINTANEFQRYVSNCDNAYTELVHQNLGKYYIQNDGWNNVQSYLQSQLKTKNQRLVLVDTGGRIIADTDNIEIGKKISETGLESPESITNSGRVVGDLYMSGCGSRAYGQAMKVDMTCQDVPVLTNDEQTFLSKINLYLWVAGIVAVVVALLLGLLLTKQITLPVRALTKGAQRVAGGDLKYQVKTDSKDELGELAVSFNQMAASLDKLEQSRKRLTADIAHELRTPLTVIEGTVDGMMDGVFKPDKEHLSWIKEQTALLTRLINDLRDLSLAESGQLKLNLDNIDVRDIVSRKISHVSVLTKKKNIGLKLYADDELPLIKADAERIEQVITNLLSNAIRHTPAGGTITVTIQKAEKDKTDKASRDFLQVSVNDTGEGISPEHLPFVFNRFYRVESSRYRESNETGLGLAIVKQMIEAHGGKVWIESTAGVGSTIFLLLPVA
jgi:signal transduction histidine kinase